MRFGDFRRNKNRRNGRESILILTSSILYRIYYYDIIVFYVYYNIIYSILIFNIGFDLYYAKKQFIMGMDFFSILSWMDTFDSSLIQVGRYRFLKPNMS